MRRFVAVLMVGTLALSASACGGGGDEAQSPPTTSAPIDLRDRAAVEIAAAAGNVFVPENVIVSPGTTVTWSNRDTIAHNVRKASEADDFGAPFGVNVSGFGSGATYAFTFANAGTYDYVCTIHTGMQGSVRVESAAAPSASPDPAP